MSSIWSSVRVPSLRASLAFGIVTRFCASNTPFFRKLVLISTSKRDPRWLVVCGTSVTRARSSSCAGMLRKRHGRILAANPMSTSHTSPRFGEFIVHFSPVEFEKHRLGVGYQFIIGQRREIKILRATQNFKGHLEFDRLR